MINAKELSAVTYEAMKAKAMKTAEDARIWCETVLETDMMRAAERGEDRVSVEIPADYRGHVKTIVTEEGYTMKSAGAGHYTISWPWFATV